MPGSRGALLLAGFATAVVPSPCCAPVVTLLAAGSPDRTIALVSIASFALGHAAPLLLAATGAARLRALAFEGQISQAVTTVGGALMVALGGYYALLA